MPVALSGFYLGADPGETGGIAMVNEDGVCVFAEKMPALAQGLLDMLRMLEDNTEIVACAIERIDPRPTVYYDKKQKARISTILRSTCIIYGDYLQLHMAMLAIRHEPIIIAPRDWQRALECPVKVKGEKKSKHKANLADYARKLFPDVKITLSTADALLIAEYCRRKTLGIL